MRATIICFTQISMMLLLVRAEDQPRIIGGFASPEGKWPFMVAFFSNHKQKCGASVWNKDYLITAAHCWSSTNPVSQLRMYLGHTDISNPDPAFLFQVKEFIIHPKHNPVTLRNDIALVRLARSIDFTGEHRQVSCVCDPEPLEYLLTDRCVVLGWGRTQAHDDKSKPYALHETDVQMFNASQCTAWDTNGQYNRHWYVCAGWLKGGKDTCKADSGGPLLCPLRANSSQYALVGLTSYGSSNCGARNSPGYYTRVESFLPWIAEQTRR